MRVLTVRAAPTERTQSPPRRDADRHTQHTPPAQHSISTRLHRTMVPCRVDRPPTRTRIALRPNLRPTPRPMPALAEPTAHRTRWSRTAAYEALSDSKQQVSPSKEPHLARQVQGHWAAALHLPSWSWMMRRYLLPAPQGTASDHRVAALLFLCQARGARAVELVLALRRDAAAGGPMTFEVTCDNRRWTLAAMRAMMRKH